MTLFYLAQSLTSPEPIIPAKEGTLDSTVESEAPPSNPSEDAEHGSVDATVGSSEASVPTKVSHFALCFSFSAYLRSSSSIQESEQTEVPTESVASLDAPAHVDVESVEEPAAARVEVNSAITYNRYCAEPCMFRNSLRPTKHQLSQPRLILSQTPAPQTRYVHTSRPISE